EHTQTQTRTRTRTRSRTRTIFDKTVRHFSSPSTYRATMPAHTHIYIYRRTHTHIDTDTTHTPTMCPFFNSDMSPIMLCGLQYLMCRCAVALLIQPSHSALTDGM